jgi:hypothetical protein
MNDGKRKSSREGRRGREEGDFEPEKLGLQIRALYSFRLKDYINISITH